MSVTFNTQAHRASLLATTQFFLGDEETSTDKIDAFLKQVDLKKFDMFRNVTVGLYQVKDSNETIYIVEGKNSRSQTHYKYFLEEKMQMGKPIIAMASP